jgi:hypothetical protein
LLTNSVFGIQSMLALGYWITPTIAISYLEQHLDSLENNCPVLAIVFMFIFVFGILLLASQPLNVVFNLIKKSWGLGWRDIEQNGISNHLCC